MAPTKVSCRSISSVSVNVNWMAPPLEGRHGIIQGYKVSYQILDQDNYPSYGQSQIKMVSDLETTLSGLVSWSNYSVTVLAFNKAGEGVPSEQIICQTDEDGKFYFSFLL